MPQPARGPAPASRTARRPRRDARLNLRTTAEQADVIRRAAEEKGVSVTQFVLDNAVTEAHRVLADRVNFVWPAEDFQKFLEMLDEPPRVDPKLVKLFSTPAPWDE